jgi:exodeoxyribonuclease-3
MRLRLCTWNINSVRPRTDQVARFVQEQAPDVLCLQEIKCLADQFPAEGLAPASERRAPAGTLP